VLTNIKVGNFRQVSNSTLAWKAKDPIHPSFIIHCLVIGYNNEIKLSFSKATPPLKHMNAHSSVCKASRDQRRLMHITYHRD